MTITISPDDTRRPDVRARREAALDRLNGGQPRPAKDGIGGRANRWARGSVSRAKPSRRAMQRTTPKAIEQLGPAPAVYYAIVVIVAAFVMLGLVMVLSATSANEVGGSESPYTVFTRQLAWAGFGLVGMGIAMSIPYQRWRALVVIGAILAGGAMMLPFVPGVGATINDANSWVRFGSFGFQPSEFLKLAAIAFLADYFARHRDELHIPRHGIIPLTLVAMACSGVSFAQGDLGSAIVLGAVVLAVGVIAGIPIVHVASVAVVGCVGASLAIVSDPRRFNRLTAFRDIEGNKEHLAWQSWQGLLSIANGGMTGSGIGGSRSKMGYLPLAHSDFIFAVVADELGFVGSVAVIGGFALLVWFGIQTALAAPDQFGLVLAGGISVWFGVQAIVHIGGVAGLLPVTGLTLPFFSAGGTSLFVSMVAAGLLLNVARRAVTTPRRATRQADRHGRQAARRPTGAMTFAVVTGGGTSGHVLPAIAVAEALVARGHDPSTIHYVGAQRGIETRLLPDTPFPHTFLDVVGFQRRLTRDNVGFVSRMWRARQAAVDLMQARRPQVVVSVGGYASMPSVFAARKLGVPVVVVSYDRFPGRASALAARRAAACAVAFPDSTLPRATLTGAPVRQSILDVERTRDRPGARTALGLPHDRFVIAVVGGSQGSGVLNEAVATLIAERAGDRELAVYHLVGERFLAAAPAARDGADGVLYRPVGYESRMPLVYAAADVLIGRGGASTVHEVAVTGTPAILVPWAASAEDHQTANVRWLSDQGAAILLREGEIGGLSAAVGRLRDHPAERDELAGNALRLGEVHRRGALAELVESVARGN